MRLKSFHAATLRDAMEEVRLELGEDAIIIDTQERPGQVRVTAAIDPEDEAAPRLRQNPMPTPSIEPRRSEQMAPPPPALAAALAAAEAESAEQWPDDWPVGPPTTTEIATSTDPDPRPDFGVQAERPVNGHAAPKPPIPPEPPSKPTIASAPTAPPSPEQVVDLVYDSLRDQGVPAVIGEEILDLVGGYETTDPHRALAATLRNMFRYRPLDGGRADLPLLLAGPPGGGKTRLTAKLAARALMTGERPSLITLDTDRMGAAAPLEAFCDAMGLQLVNAETPEGLAGAFAATKGADLVLVDTPGCNHLSDQDMVGLGRYLIGAPAEVIAVLPAGLDPVESADIAHAFADLGATRMLVPRVDAARRIGSVLAAAFGADLAFAEFSATSRIKDGLTVVDPLRLAHLLLPPAQGSEWPHQSRQSARGTG